MLLSTLYILCCLYICLKLPQKLYLFTKKVLTHKDLFASAITTITLIPSSIILYTRKLLAYFVRDLRNNSTAKQYFFEDTTKNINRLIHHKLSIWLVMLVQS